MDYLEVRLSLFVCECVLEHWDCLYGLQRVWLVFEERWSGTDKYHHITFVYEPAESNNKYK